MAFTFKELRQAKENIADGLGLSSGDAARVVGYFNGGGPAMRPDIVKSVIDGDLSGVGPALAALGLDKDQEKIIFDPQKITRKDQAKKTSGPKNGGSKQKNDSDTQKIDGDLREGVQGSGVDDIEIVADSHELPPGLHDDICAIIDGFADSHGIQDKQKIHPLQFGAACTLVGVSIKKRGILLDVERNRREGGVKYNPHKVLALLYLYEYICSCYKQVPFSHNFPKFAGVSREYFNDYAKQGLTSSHLAIAQKAHEIQRAGLVDAVNGGGSATVGNIFLSKALAGLQESTTVVHVSASAAPSVAALPVFGDDGALLEEKPQ